MPIQVILADTSLLTPGSSLRLSPEATASDLNARKHGDDSTETSIGGSRIPMCKEESNQPGLDSTQKPKKRKRDTKAAEIPPPESMAVRII